MNLKMLLILSFVVFITGCVGNTNKDDEPRGNCVVTECIKQIEATDTILKVNEIIGFEYEKDNDKYIWKLDKKNSITIDKSLDNQVVEATIEKDSIKNKDLDLSVYNDIKALLDNGKSLTYEEMVLKLGGINGTLAGKTSTTIRYIWVDRNERTFSATFSNKNNKCTIISIR